MIQPTFNNSLGNWYGGAATSLGDSPSNPFAIRPINTPGGIAGYTGYGQGQPGQAVQWPYSNRQNTFDPQSRFTSLLNTYGQNGPVYNPASNSYTPATGGTPVWNGSAWVDSASGHPFTGSYGGSSFSGGQSYQQMANDPTSRYQSISIVKNPGVAAATDTLTSSFKPTPGITNFSDLLDAARTTGSTATAGLASDLKAYDTSGLGTTLDALNQNLSKTNSGLNTTYSDILNRTAGNENAIANTAAGLLPSQYQALQGLNNQYGDTTGAMNNYYSSILAGLGGQYAGDISKGYANLDQYDTAAQAVADMQQKALLAQLSSYKMGTGTPASLGSNEQSMLLSGLQNIQLPTQLAKAKAAQDLLTGYVTPLQTGLANARIEQLTGFSLPIAQQLYGANYGTQQGYNQAQQDILRNLQLPLAQQQGQRELSQLTGFTAPMAQQDYSNAYNTATMLKNLQLQTAGLSIQDAVNYMKAMALPDQIIQQVLAGNQSLQAGDISNLSGLNALYGNSRYQGLWDTFGAYPSQPTVTTFNAPNPGGGGAPSGGGRGQPTQPNAPMNIYLPAYDQSQPQQQQPQQQPQQAQPQPQAQPQSNFWSNPVGNAMTQYPNLTASAAQILANLF